VQAFTTEKVTGDLKAVDWSTISKRWKHLHSIPFAAIKGRQTIDMLIGIDNAELHFAFGGKAGEPTARLTPIGWTCVGQIAKGGSTQQTLFCHECSNDATDLLKRFWAIEEVPEGGKDALKSADEQNAEAMVAKSLTAKGHRYQVAMPWKVDPNTLPDNRQSATRRLVSTERRLLKEPALAAAYQAVLDDHQEKGYVRRLETKEEIAEPQWFLPHFAVVRHDKDTTKTRIVFDASARHQGVCLNDFIYTGPKLQNDLLRVLCYAFGDIQSPSSATSKQCTCESSWHQKTDASVAFCGERWRQESSRMSSSSTASCSALTVHHSLPNTSHNRMQNGTQRSFRWLLRRSSTRPTWMTVWILSRTLLRRSSCTVSW
jgi:hypothetical protein